MSTYAIKFGSKQKFVTAGNRFMPGTTERYPAAFVSQESAQEFISKLNLKAATVVEYPASVPFYESAQARLGVSL